MKDLISGSQVFDRKPEGVRRELNRNTAIEVKPLHLSG
jgi:hypothetical protein